MEPNHNPDTVAKQPEIIANTQRFDLITVSSIPEHHKFIASLWSTPLFQSSEGLNKAFTPETGKRVIENRFLKEYERYGHGTYIIRLKPSLRSPEIEATWPGGLIGTVSLTRGDGPQCATAPDLGYSVIPELNGQGFATEASKVILEWATREKRLTAVFGFCDPDNKASNRVLEKCGFVYKGVKKLMTFGGKESSVYVLPSMNEDLSVYNLVVG